MSESQDLNNNAPFDDYGVHNDHMLEICDILVMQLWKTVQAENENLSIADIMNASVSLETIWNLIQSIIDMDDNLRENDDILDENDDDIENNDESEDL